MSRKNTAEPKLNKTKVREYPTFSDIKPVKSLPIVKPIKNKERVNDPID